MPPPTAKEKAAFFALLRDLKRLGAEKLSRLR